MAVPIQVRVFRRHEIQHYTTPIASPLRGPSPCQGRVKSPYWPSGR